MLLEGLFLPLTTPFYRDGRVYFRKLEHNVASYGRTPASGLVLLSETGEAHALSDQEMEEVLRVAAQAAPREKVLLAGISRNSVAGSLALAQIAFDLGYDAALLRSPDHFISTEPARIEAERLLYFRAIADRSPLPLVLVDGVEVRGRLFPLNFIAEMSRHSQVIGVVTSQPEPEYLVKIGAATATRRREVIVTSIFAAVTRRMMADPKVATAGNYIAVETLTGGAFALAQSPPKPVIKTRVRQVGFHVLAGHSSGMLDALSAGASAVMPPLGVCAPQACYEVYAAWKDGDQRLAEEKQERIQAAAQILEEQIGPAAIKCGCDRNGYYGGPPRLPGLSLSSTEELSVFTAMEHLRS